MGGVAQGSLRSWSNTTQRAKIRLPRLRLMSWVQAVATPSLQLNARQSQLPIAAGRLSRRSSPAPNRRDNPASQRKSLPRLPACSRLRAKSRSDRATCRGSCRNPAVAESQRQPPEADRRSRPRRRHPRRNWRLPLQLLLQARSAPKPGRQARQPRQPRGMPTPAKAHRFRATIFQIEASALAPLRPSRPEQGRFRLRLRPRGL